MARRFSLVSYSIFTRNCPLKIPLQMIYNPMFRRLENKGILIGRGFRGGADRICWKHEFFGRMKEGFYLSVICFYVS